jgi:23S rRNA (guanine745-N1)-methyltransferase
VLDVGCGEGSHTRLLDARTVLGVDVSKPAVAAAAKAHRSGWYAVASASALPLPDASVDAAVSVFGPVFAEELARAVRPGGTVVTAHPGPAHLTALRALVYEQARPYEPKPPLQGGIDWFDEVSSVPLHFSVSVSDLAGLRDLFAMTPYRWHGPRDIERRLAEAARGVFVTEAEVRVNSYRRRAHAAHVTALSEPGPRAR